MEGYQEIIDKISKTPDDLKVEVLLAELIENDQLNWTEKKVKTLGIFRRGYRKEIDQVEIEKGQKFEEFRHLSFSIWREGLYDSLPKGIFHQVRKGEGKKNLNEIKKDVEEEQKEREAARDFFYPFEQEFYNQRIALEMAERKVLSGFKGDIEARYFSEDFWGIDVKGIDNAKVVSLLYLLPYAFMYKGQLKELATLFSIVLKDPVRWENTYGNQQKVKEEEVLSLGSAYLGENLVLGESFEDNIPHLVMVIGPMSPSQAAKYLPGQEQYKLLNVLERFFLPMETQLEVQLEIRREERRFYLPQDQAEKDQPAYNNILGYTTFI